MSPSEFEFIFDAMINTENRHSTSRAASPIHRDRVEADGKGKEDSRKKI